MQINKNGISVKVAAVLFINDAAVDLLMMLSYQFAGLTLTMRWYGSG